MSSSSLPESFDTVTEATAWLQQHGYDHDFNLDKDSIRHSSGYRLRPDEFHIEKAYRFEGITDPGDEDVVYAIASADGKTKGSLIAAYGTYADTLSQEMISKLAVH